MGGCGGLLVVPQLSKQEDFQPCLLEQWLDGILVAQNPGPSSRY